MSGLAGEDFGDRDALILGLVRQHGPGDDIADGIDAVDIGLVVRVGHDAAALVERNAGLIQPQALGKRNAADGDQRDIGFDVSLLRPRRARASPQGLFGLFDAGDLGASLNSKPCLPACAGTAWRLPVHSRQDAVEKLDDGNLGPKPRPDRAQLQADNARADHQQIFGHLDRA